MCVIIRKREEDKKKEIVAWKIFAKKKTGLFPQYRNSKVPVERQKWITSTRVGWHAYLRRYLAYEDSDLGFVVKKVKLRKILGYGHYWNAAGKYQKVRALEMYIL